jgi:hypothetical protein
MVFIIGTLIFLTSVIWFWKTPRPANDLEGKLIVGGSALIFSSSFLILLVPSWLEYDKTVARGQLISTGLIAAMMILGYNFIIIGFVLLFYGRKPEKTSFE